MDSDSHNRQQQQQQMNSSLTRYRSAPSSYFVNLMNSKGGYGGEELEQFLNPQATTPASEQILKRFVSETGSDDSNSRNLYGIAQNTSPNEPGRSQLVAPLKHKPEVYPHHHQQQQEDSSYASASRVIYQSQSQVHHNSETFYSSADHSYRLVSSPGMDHLPDVKMGGGTNSSLVRHSSSPAGLFSNINVDTGYGLVRGMGSFGAGDNTNAEASFSSASRLKGEVDLSSGPSSSSLLMTRGEGSFGESNKNIGGNIPGFPISSWDDSPILSDDFLKGLGDNEDGEGGKRAPTLLSHHLSLPKSSVEMERLLQLHDSVPCKTRAKRGCATHPRSIAERVRRTKISERMRKLHELVPNMDKQTNTADMLDLAVNYIEDLQKQVKTLSDNHAKCICSNKEKP